MHLRYGALAFIFAAGSAYAASPGFVEDFHNAGSLGNFFSGATLSNPGAGGVGGASDGFLMISRNPAGNFAAATDASEFTGDLIADGVTGFSFYLNDVGAHQNFEMHLALGTAASNFWINTVPLASPDNAWAFSYVSIMNPAEWQQVQGSGTFQQAMQNCTRLQIRHDIQPFGSGGDSIAGEIGFDRITVVPEPSSMLAMLPVLFFLRRKR